MIVVVSSSSFVRWRKNKKNGWIDVKTFSYANESYYEFIHIHFKHLLWDFLWNRWCYSLLWCIVALYILWCIPVIHSKRDRRHQRRKLLTGGQLDKLNGSLWSPPTNLIFPLSCIADEYGVFILFVSISWKWNIYIYIYLNWTKSDVWTFRFL